MSEQRALRIGVVGLGQCGGNLAAAFGARGYPALAVNTSEADLRTLTELDDTARMYIGIDGLNGAGGNPGIGGQCLAQKADEIEAVVNELPDVEALLVMGGLGGGTGGNLAALVERLATDLRPVIALGVLPASAESYAAKVNALQAVNGLIDAPFEALVLVDNQRLLSTYANAGMDQYFTEGNAAVVEAFDALNRLPGRADLTAIRTYDPGELRETLLAGGVALYGSRSLETPLAPDALVGALKELTQSHPVLGAGYALEDAVVVSAVLVLDPDSLADTPATVLGEFTTSLKEETGGAAVHVGLYGGDVSKPKLYVALGGFPLPGRAQELLEEAGREAERIAKKRAPRKRLQKLDLSGLAPAGPPAAPGKGMVKAEARPQGGGESADEVGPVVDLDFEDGEAPVVEEEIVDEFGEVTGIRDFDDK